MVDDQEGGGRGLSERTGQWCCWCQSGRVKGSGAWAGCRGAACLILEDDVRHSFEIQGQPATLRPRQLCRPRVDFSPTLASTTADHPGYHWMAASLADDVLDVAEQSCQGSSS